MINILDVFSSVHFWKEVSEAVSGICWGHFFNSRLESLVLLLSLGLWPLLSTFLVSPWSICLTSHISSSWRFCHLVFLYLLRVLTFCFYLLPRYSVDWSVFVYRPGWRSSTGKRDSIFVLSFSNFLGDHYLSYILGYAFQDMLYTAAFHFYRHMLHSF